ncbi:MAG: type II toxin-antitoxin system Phd/YefM family antitoxin [Prevotella sp.]|nr:type II toxin-antitoxin system Phd/YefM family antitoxin [Prevotella sp.]
MRTATFSDFSSNIKNYFNSVIDNCDSIIVNRNSDEAAVLLSLDEYNSLIETLYLMSSRDTMADIRKAEQDIKEGKGIEVNLDEL